MRHPGVYLFQIFRGYNFLVYSFEAHVQACINGSLTRRGGGAAAARRPLLDTFMGVLPSERKFRFFSRRYWDTTRRFEVVAKLSLSKTPDLSASDPPSQRLMGHLQCSASHSPETHTMLNRGNQHREGRKVFLWKARYQLRCRWRAAKSSEMRFLDKRTTSECGSDFRWRVAI